MTTQYYKVLRPGQDGPDSLELMSFNGAYVQACGLVLCGEVEYALVIPAKALLEEVVPLRVDAAHLEGMF